MTATPSAPPTWRVVSFTAEPTPALPSGSEPMIDSVAGAIVSAMPHAMSTMPPDDVGPVRRWSTLSDAQRHETSGDHEQSPVPTTSFVPMRSHEPRAQRRRRTIIAAANGQEPDAGLERRVAEHELEVLREQERRAEHGEEHQHDARGSRR